MPANPDLLERITVDPEQCGGRPCIRGMRIRVIDVLELLAAGESPASRKKLIIYKTIEILDGRAVPRYSSEKPSSGSFQIVSR